MSEILIKKIRGNRLFKKSVTDAKTGRVYTFTCRRPTDYEASEFKLGRSLRVGDGDCEIAQRFVEGFEGIVEDDIVGGGGTEPVVFDPLLWREWCADREDFWRELAKAIVDRYKEHTAEMEQAQKNLASGSTNVA